MDVIFKLQSLEEFDNVSKDIANNMYSSRQVTSDNVSAEKIKIAKEDIKKLLSNCNYEMDKVANILIDQGYDQKRVQGFITLLESKKAELLYQTFIHYNSSYGEMVTDFNWLLKLVLGTNDLKTLRYPLLQLILHTVNSSEEENQRIYDISKDMLMKLIHLLESIDEK